MLCYIWVSVRGALSTAGCFWISGMAAQRCGQLSSDHPLAIKVGGSFFTGLFAALADSEGRWLVSPSLRQFFMIVFFTVSFVAGSTIPDIVQEKWVTPLENFFAPSHVLLHYIVSF
jgi:hypothetical protein